MSLFIIMATAALLLVADNIKYNLEKNKKGE